jgi:translation initiation factor IF-2
MRSRGARVADLAVLVVAADDGVKPQTKEAISILKETKTPFVVAINKIDKNNSDPERVKNELLQAEVLLEGYGGNVSFQLVSAKTGEGVNELLDHLLLAAEVEQLTYDPSKPGTGVVVEAKLDRRRGHEVIIVLKDGILRRGDEVGTPSAKGKVKGLENFSGVPMGEITPSSPALVWGFEKLPAVGEEFVVGGFGEAVKIPKAAAKPREVRLDGQNKRTLRLILKADVQGSLEALHDIIKAMSDPEIEVQIMDAHVGDVSDGDVKLAITNGAKIMGFRVRTEKAAQVLAQANAVTIISGEIIYELIKVVQEEIKNIKDPRPTGILEVLAVFNQKSAKQLIGGKVLEGVLKRGLYQVQRGVQIVGSGKIVSLEQNKREVVQVEAGKECGMFFESPTKIEVGYQLLAKPAV